jgi:pectinesterase
MRCNVTAYYDENANSEPGADIAQRVTWSHQLTKKEAKKYAIKNILSPVLPFEKPVEEWIRGE